MDATDYTQYRPLMFSIAYRMTGSVSDAEDIVQEAFLKGTKAEVASNAKAYLERHRQGVARLGQLGGAGLVVGAPVAQEGLREPGADVRLAADPRGAQVVDGQPGGNRGHWPGRSSSAPP